VRGEPLIVIDRDLPAGNKEGSSGICWYLPPGEEVVSFSPQNRTAALPVFATRRLPVAFDPKISLGI
jgi:hypothetical protein